MKLPTALLTLPLGLTHAQWSHWSPPGQGDLRGPCPGLNSLANHALLPHNGSNITLPVAIAALAHLNISTETATLLTLAGLQTSSDPASGAFTLKDLGKHGIIEHDGSLSRQDAALPGGEKLTLNKEVYARFLRHFEGRDEASVRLAAAARWDAIKHSRKTNPEFTYSLFNRAGSYAETAVYFGTLMDGAKNAVPLRFLRILFEEERFPAKEGWKPLFQHNALSVASMVLQLALNTPEEAEEEVAGTGTGTGMGMGMGMGLHAAVMQEVLEG